MTASEIAMPAAPLAKMVAKEISPEPTAADPSAGEREQATKSETPALQPNQAATLEAPVSVSSANVVVAAATTSIGAFRKAQAVSGPLKNDWALATALFPLWGALVLNIFLPRWLSSVTGPHSTALAPFANSAIWPWLFWVVGNGALCWLDAIRLKAHDIRVGWIWGALLVPFYFWKRGAAVRDVLKHKAKWPFMLFWIWLLSAALAYFWLVPVMERTHNFESVTLQTLIPKL